MIIKCPCCNENLNILDQYIVCVNGCIDEIPYDFLKDLLEQHSLQDAFMLAYDFYCKAEGFGYLYPDSDDCNDD
ncbi:MAG: hypothetical protein J6B43_04150 [Lachnospiraceae bacterium]|nr:hypothetical protein [Lachnospiraceae bacterium]